MDSISTIRALFTGGETGNGSEQLAITEAFFPCGLNEDELLQINEELKNRRFNRITIFGQPVTEKVKIAAKDAFSLSIKKSAETGYQISLKENSLNEKQYFLLRNHPFPPSISTSTPKSVNKGKPITEEDLLIQTLSQPPIFALHRFPASSISDSDRLISSFYRLKSKHPHPLCPPGLDPSRFLLYHSRSCLKESLSGTEEILEKLEFNRLVFFESLKIESENKIVFKLVQTAIKSFLNRELTHFDVVHNKDCACHVRALLTCIYASDTDVLNDLKRLSKEFKGLTKKNNFDDAAKKIKATPEVIFIVLQYLLSDDIRFLLESDYVRATPSREPQRIKGLGLDSEHLSRSLSHLQMTLFRKICKDEGLDLENPILIARKGEEGMNRPIPTNWSFLEYEAIITIAERRNLPILLKVRMEGDHHFKNENNRLFRYGEQTQKWEICERNEKATPAIVVYATAQCKEELDPLLGNFKYDIRKLILMEIAHHDPFNQETLDYTLEQTRSRLASYGIQLEENIESKIRKSIKAKEHPNAKNFHMIHFFPSDLDYAWNSENPFCPKADVVPIRQYKHMIIKKRDKRMASVLDEMPTKFHKNLPVFHPLDRTKEPVALDTTTKRLIELAIKTEPQSQFEEGYLSLERMIVLLSWSFKETSIVKGALARLLYLFLKKFYDRVYLESKSNLHEICTIKDDKLIIKNQILLIELFLLDLAIKNEIHHKANSDLQYEIASLYREKGKTDQYLYWLKTAAANDFLAAMSDLGARYLEEGDESEQAEGFDLILKAAAEGDAKTKYQMGLIYERSKSGFQSLTDARKCFKFAANKGHLEGTFHLANYYLLGLGGRQRSSRAFDLFVLAGKEHAEAQYRAGMCHAFGIGTKQDSRKAFECFQSAAKKKHLIAQSIIAKEFSSNANQFLNRNEWISQYHKLFGIPIPETESGKRLLLGRLKVDREAVAVKFAKSNEKNNLSCCFKDIEESYFDLIGSEIAEMLLTDTINTVESVYFDLIASWPNHFDMSGFDSPEILLYMGTNRMKGRRLNQLVGFDLIRKAAALGNSEANYQLGLCYERGKGTSRDFDQAHKSFIIAYNSGHLEATYALACSYHFGRGVGMNLKESFRLFMIAANRGHVESRFRIAMCYAFGEGTTQDSKMAHKWFQLAARDGHTAAESIINKEFRPNNSKIAFRHDYEWTYRYQEFFGPLIPKTNEEKHLLVSRLKMELKLTLEEIKNKIGKQHLEDDLFFFFKTIKADAISTILNDINSINKSDQEIYGGVSMDDVVGEIPEFTSPVCAQCEA